MPAIPSTLTGRPFPFYCTGTALETVKKHSDPKNVSITLFGVAFSPFVQRVWTALEYLEIPYHYHTVTLPNQTEEFLALSPKGLLPALRLNDFSPPRGLNESLVILDYLNDLSATKGNKKTLLPPVEFTWSRALLRLQADLISRTLVPTYFRYLQSQDPAIQEQHRLEIIDGIEKLIRLFERAEQEREDEAPKFGLWEEEGLLSLPDILLAPWVFRARITLKHYRGFSFSPVFASHPRFEGYVDRLMGHPAFKATCSTDDVCLDSAASYAANRSPSQIAAAINRGREIP